MISTCVPTEPLAACQMTKWKVRTSGAQTAALCADVLDADVEHGIDLQFSEAPWILHADYGFEYSEDDEPEEDEQIETENTYYGAKGVRCLRVLATASPRHAWHLFS